MARLEGGGGLTGWLWRVAQRGLGAQRPPTLLQKRVLLACNRCTCWWQAMR